MNETQNIYPRTEADGLAALASLETAAAGAWDGSAQPGFEHKVKQIGVLAWTELGEADDPIVIEPSAIPKNSIFPQDL